MNSLVTGPNILSQWYDLVRAAGKASVIELPEEIENYLIFLLIHFMSRPEIASNVLGKSYLEGLDEHLKARQVLLKDVGDQCLLIAGFFPARASKKQVKISYFVKLGQNSYTALSQSATKEAIFSLYKRLSEKFVSMMDLLQTMRNIDGVYLPQLSPLEAYELWNDTNSVYARKILEFYTQFEPVKSVIIKSQG